MSTVVLQVILGSCIYGIWPWSGHSWDTPLAILLVILQFLSPLIILGFCYGTIMWKLARATVPSEISQTHQTDVYQKARKNVAVTFCIVAFFYAVCWAPHQTIYFMYYLGYPVDWNSVLWHIVIQMVFLNCTINPFIYLVKSADFQNALKEFMTCSQA